MPLPKIALVALSSVLCLAGATACGGDVGSLATADAGGSDSGGGSDGGGGTDSSPPLSAGCPTAVPSTGSSCTNEGLQCEYGDSWWSVSCDPVVQCNGGQWSTYKPSFEPCSPQPGPNAASCPSDYASVPQGSACTTTGLSCVYAQGECSCQVPLEGPVLIDGGSGYWGCVPEQGCPFPRPPLGSACTNPSGTESDCTYEACAYAQTCQNGAWVALEEACAGTGGGGGLGGP
jgi:hypothetical protein